MSDAVDRQEGGAALRVLFCFGALQPFFDLEIDEFPAVMNAIVGAFDDLEGRFGVHVIGTMDDDELVSGPTDTYPWTAYVLADAPSLDAVKRVRFRREIYDRELLEHEAQGVFVFAPGGERTGTTVHSRMFAPEMGIQEDPATGAASGPLGAYLVRYGLVQGDEELVRIVSEQGFEMGRPSLVSIGIEHQGETITRVLVGGQCHYMAEGTFTLA